MRQHQKTLLPVIFPGFSWRNLSAMRDEDEPLNAVPRLNGESLWAQARARLHHGATSLYVAMFDELDEATAIIKATPTPPVHDTLKFVNDPHLPSDHYLWLTSQIAQALHTHSPLPQKIPTRPNTKPRE